MISKKTSSTVPASSKFGQFELKNKDFFISVLAKIGPYTLSYRIARRVVGNICCVTVGDPSLRPVSDANSASPLRLSNPSFTRWRCL